MGIKAYKRTTCRLCDSSSLELVIPLSPIPVAEKYVTEAELDTPTDVYPVDLYMCLDCGHVQVLDILDPKVLWDDFTFRSGQAPAIVKHLYECATNVCDRYNVPASSLVVDVGSNDGTLLGGFKAHGTTVLGIDPATEIAQEANQSGVETICDFLTMDLAEKIKRERGGATVITCFNAFAHADDLSGMAASISHLLISNGVFVFEVSYLLDILDDLLLGVIFHEHLSHHSVTPLIQFLQRHGMELIDVEHVPLQGGSIIGTAQRLGGPHAVSSEVQRFVDVEAMRALHDPRTMRVFSTRLSGLEAQITAYCTEWQAAGATIAGYGAARSGPTLIGEFGLADAISFIVDDHPQKVNRYTPGHHIRVYPTSELYARMPDYAVILAWVHADKIIAENQLYLERGGCFVLCFPEVRLITSERPG